MFTISQLDITNLPDQLLTFCNNCQQDSIVNNSSLAKMKIGTFEKEAWWATWYQDEIISVSGMHKWDKMGADVWRVMFRTATLKKYRGQAGPVSKKLTNDFNWGKILPLQISHGLQNNCQKFLFTTNSDIDGDPGSYKTNRIVSTAFVKEGLVRPYQTDVVLYGKVQNVWEIII